MDIGTINLAAASTAGSGTAAAGGNGSAASTESNGFSQLLIEAIGGQVEADAGASLPDLEALLGGLTSLQAAVQPAESEQGTDSALIQDWMEKLAQQPELLEKLLGDDDFQAWILQASELLQGLGVMPAQVQQIVEPGKQTESGSGSNDFQPAVTLQQAATVLAFFRKAVQEQPGQLFLGQLQESLAELISGHPELSFGASSLTVSPSTGSSVRSPDKAEGKGAAEAAGKPLQDNGYAIRKQSSDPATGIKVQQPAVTAHPHRLEALAAKAAILAVRASSLQPDSPEAQQTSAQSSEEAAAKTLAVESQQGLARLLQPLKEAAVQAPLPSDSFGTLAGTAEEGNANSLTAAFHQQLARMTPIAKDAAVQAPVSAGNFAEEMSRFVMGRIKIDGFGGLTEARLSLTPESLGHVDVKLTMQNGQLVAHFAAQTAAGKEVLEAQLPQLRLALQNQGIQVEKMEVTQSATLQSGMFQGDRQQQSAQQFARRKPSSPVYSEAVADDFSVELDAVRGRPAMEREGFDVTA